MTLWSMSYVCLLTVTLTVLCVCVCVCVCVCGVYLPAGLKALKTQHSQLASCWLQCSLWVGLCSLSPQLVSAHLVGRE